MTKDELKFVRRKIVFQEKILKKSYRILALSVGILILGLIFFFWRGMMIYQKINQSTTKQNQFQVQPLSPGFQPQKDVLISQPSKSNLPAPDKFSIFNFNQTKGLEIKTKCADAYYTILIFSLDDDYRQNPETAKFNRAFPCQVGQEIKQTIDLTILNLSPGKYYYLVADQGETGSWYNPR